MNALFGLLLMLYWRSAGFDGPTALVEIEAVLRDEAGDDAEAA